MGGFCGNSSVVEHNLAKVGVASSNLVSRSSFEGKAKLPLFYWLGSRMVMQRPAKPCMPVRFRPQPPPPLYRSGSCYIEPQRHDVRLGWQDIPAVVRVERLRYSRTRGRASYIRSETFLDNTLVAGLGVRHLMLWHQRACVRLPQPQSRSQEYLTDARLKRLAASSVAKRLDSDTSSIAR